MPVVVHGRGIRRDEAAPEPPPELILNTDFATDFTYWTSGGLNEGGGIQFQRTTEGYYGNCAEFSDRGGT